MFALAVFLWDREQMTIEKILIIDDSSISRKIIKSCIPKDKEYEFFEAQDGKKGLEKFIEIRPDVTFLDLTMPVMGGVECLEKILKFSKNAIVVVVTADVQIKSISKVTEIGAFRVIKKPPSKEGLQKVLIDIQNNPGE